MNKPTTAELINHLDRFCNSPMCSNAADRLEELETLNQAESESNHRQAAKILELEKVREQLKDADYCGAIAVKRYQRAEAKLERVIDIAKSCDFCTELVQQALQGEGDVPTV